MRIMPSQLVMQPHGSGVMQGSLGLTLCVLAVALG
jgi:hypothetical protein